MLGGLGHLRRRLSPMLPCSMRRSISAPNRYYWAVQLYHVKCQLSSTHESVAPLVPPKDYMVIA